MKKRSFRDCAEGTAAIEFAFVGPIFIGLMFAIVQGGLMLWTQMGLQHAVESAARCSAINTSTCGTATAIQSYAATQAYSLNMPASAFSFAKASCGNQVSASYNYSFFSQIFSSASVALSASACFPT